MTKDGIGGIRVASILGIFLNAYFFDLISFSSTCFYADQLLIKFEGYCILPLVLMSLVSVLLILQ